MSREAELEARFAKLGGAFLTPPSVLRARMKSIRGIVSDWDGVFNAGSKGEGATSTFGEPDSMGINLLRYALYREHNRLPVAALITGEDNPSARAFAQREHFHA
ncbi:MAG TPA: phosphatase, partial [Gammaproteobacteria bacterium]|nr:phosphatase [Gammaproteobacteria bacterium]